MESDVERPLRRFLVFGRDDGLFTSVASAHDLVQGQRVAVGEAEELVVVTGRVTAPEWMDAEAILFVSSVN